MVCKFTRLTEKHLDLVRNWRNSPEVGKYMYTNSYITKEEHLNWFIKVNDDSTKAYWVINVDNIDVGVVNLYNIDLHNRRCYWAYYLADFSVRGKGIGRLIEFNILKYVFEKLKLNKLCCEIFSWNNLVVQIHQKYGSKIEGEFRQHIYKDGKFHSIICMSILKEEWEEIRKKADFSTIYIE